MGRECFCLQCGKTITFDDNHCPYCGRNQGIKESAEQGMKLFSGISNTKPKKQQFGFSLEEIVLFGLHPKDDMLREGLIMKILGKR